MLLTVADASQYLGSRWNHQLDPEVVSGGTSPDLNKAITQRLVLSVVSSVYDPSGLVVPYTVTTRLLLKGIWILGGQQWDDNLPEAVFTHFLEWS